MAGQGLYTQFSKSCKHIYSRKERKEKKKIPVWTLGKFERIVFFMNKDYQWFHLMGGKEKPKSKLVANREYIYCSLLRRDNSRPWSSTYSLLDETRSMIVAFAVPPPSQIACRPYLALRLSISCRRVVINLVPVAPNGWPSAIAPPFTFSLFKSALISYEPQNRRKAESVTEMRCKLQTEDKYLLPSQRNRCKRLVD